MNYQMSGSRLEARRGPAYMATGRDDGERAFRGASRHSRGVRILRIAIPIGVVVCLVGVLLATWLNPLRLVYRLPADIGNVVISGTKITMEQPRIAGFTKDSRAYEVNARAAAQDLSNPTVVEFHDIRAKLDLPDKTVMQITAQNGLYNTKTQTLTLGKEILLNSANGYEGRLTEAIIDIQNQRLVSNEPVELKTLQGKLNANRLEVTGFGEVMRFEGGVAMVLDPSKQASAKVGESTEKPAEAANTKTVNE